MTEPTESNTFFETTLAVKVKDLVTGIFTWSSSETLKTTKQTPLFVSTAKSNQITLSEDEQPTIGNSIVCDCQR